MDYWEVIHKAPSGEEAYANKFNTVCSQAGMVVVAAG